MAHTNQIQVDWSLLLAHFQVCCQAQGGDSVLIAKSAVHQGNQAGQTAHQHHDLRL